MERSSSTLIPARDRIKSKRRLSRRPILWTILTFHQQWNSEKRHNHIRHRIQSVAKKQSSWNGQVENTSCKGLAHEQSHAQCCHVKTPRCVRPARVCVKSKKSKIMSAKSETCMKWCELHEAADGASGRIQSSAHDQNNTHESRAKESSDSGVTAKTVCRCM